MLKRLLVGYQKLIEYFVPEAIKADREASNQARMFLISHTLGPILGNTIPLALYVIDPTPGIDIVITALSVTAFWIFPFLLRRGVNYDALVVTSVLNLNFCIFWCCYFNGGVLAPTLPWILLIPILSFFYIGGNTRLQRPLMSIFAGSFALFLVLYYTVNPPPSDIPEIALLILGIISTATGLCYVATMAIYYARIFDAGVELEIEVRRRRAATDELRTAIVAADDAGRHKAEFLARMSHELRTPLNAVIGYSQILKEDALESNDRQMREDVDRIHDAGQYLVRLINIILDLSKIEAGRMQFTVDDHDLTEIVSDVISHVRPAMVENDNTFDLFVETRKLTVGSDRQRLAQILTSILENAPAHAPGSHIEIRLSEMPAADGAGACRISVRDNGKGIPAERLATLFDSLIDRTDASASKYGGTGLNLTIAHKLARAIGCDLTVESATGEGTCFVLTVPYLWTVGETAPAAASPAALAA